MKNKITSFFAVSKATTPLLLSSTKKRPNSKCIDLPESTKEGTANTTKRTKVSSTLQPTSFSTISSNTEDHDLKAVAVEELLQYLHDDTSKHPSSWKQLLQKHFETKRFVQLAQFIYNERRMMGKESNQQEIYPSNTNLWTALNSCSIQNVKVVIVGQDPYHQPHQAHGLSFSVLPNCPTGIPPSLKNIYKELLNDPDVPNFTKIPHHGYLVRWIEQGVLLLNSVLTVRHNTPNSHQKKGWEEVTDEIIRLILQYHCCDDPNTTSQTATTTTTKPGRGCVFLLWGKPATTKAMQMIESVTTTTTKGKSKSATMSSSTIVPTQRYNPNLYTVICTSHPSPLGAMKTSSPFLGSQCFSRCNRALQQMGHTPIDWNVE